MLKTYLLYLALFYLGLGLSHAQETKKDTVFFDFDNYKLSSQYQNNLIDFLDDIDGFHLVQINISGYTDNTGSDFYNKELSRKRINEVLEILKSRGFDESIIDIHVMGNQNPIGSNSTELGRQKNRRVEITAKFKLPVITDVYSYFDKQKQNFSFLSDKEIEIIGKQGTRINIAPNSLIDSEGKLASGMIDFTLEEFYSTSDIIQAKLNTTSDGEILETAGMIKISATSNGKELRIKDGSTITVEFKSNDSLDQSNMQLFNGQFQHGHINWELGESNEKSSKELPVKVYNNNPILNSDADLSFDIPNEEYRESMNLIFKSTKLGWINCDRFYDVADKIDLIVHVDSIYNPFVFLVFEDIRSVMMGIYIEADRVIFNGIPVDQKVKLVGFSMADEVPFYGCKEYVISTENNLVLQLNKTTIKRLKSELKKLN